MNKTKFRMYLDIVLFTSFVIVNMPQFTGIALHEWLSFVFLPIIVVHVVLDWQWIVNITKRFFTRIKGEIRFNYILNFLLFFLMVTVIFSGILISQEALPFMGISVTISPYWASLHEMAANLLMLTIGIHLAMHWKWIINTTSRYLFRRDGSKIAAEKGVS